MKPTRRAVDAPPPPPIDAALAIDADVAIDARLDDAGEPQAEGDGGGCCRAGAGPGPRR